MSLAIFYRRSTRLLYDNFLALLLLLIFSFVMLHWLPGNQADILFDNGLNIGSNQAAYDDLVKNVGLDKPIWKQFLSWFFRVIQGDLGYSYIHSASVKSLVMDAISWTLSLILLSIPLSLIVGVSLGLSSGGKSESPLSKILFTLITMVSSVPSFVIALLLLSFFGFGLNWFPTDGGGMSLETRITGDGSFLDIVWHGFLPLLAVSLQASIRYFYLSYGLGKQITLRPFIFYARMRGIEGFRLLIRWCLPNAVPEILSKLSSTLPGIIGSTIFIEVVFSYPGAGNLMLDAINNRDYVLLQGCLLIFASVILILNTFLDILSSALSSRG